MVMLMKYEDKLVILPFNALKAHAIYTGYIMYIMYRVIIIKILKRYKKKKPHIRMTPNLNEIILKNLESICNKKKITIHFTNSWLAQYA